MVGLLHKGYTRCYCDYEGMRKLETRQNQESDQKLNPGPSGI